MTMHSFYFLSYALILTLSGMVMLSAYRTRMKREGTAVNHTLLAVVFGGALFMWTGVAVTEYVYNPNMVNAGFSLFFMAAWVAAGITWQVKTFAGKRPTAERQFATGSY